MMKLIKKFSWTSIIVMQTLAGILVSVLFLSFMKADTVPADMSVGSLPIGGFTLDEAGNAISDYYNELIKSGKLVVEIDGKASEIAWTDFDAAIDTNKTIENLKNSIPGNGLGLFLSGLDRGKALKPELTYNSGKLLTYCEKLFSPLERAPVSEHYEINNGQLRFVPQVPGIKTDYDLLEKELREKLLSLSQEPYTVDTSNTLLLKEQPGGSIYKEPFTTLVSSAKISFDGELDKKVQNCLEPMQCLIFENGREIDLNKLLDFSDFDSDVEKDLLNRISTALYQSALPLDGIKVLSRRPSKRVVSYTQSGLEAVIEGEDANLVLQNDTGRPLMLLTEVEHGAMTFYMASTGELKSGILIVQKKDEVPPPVITSVNTALSPGTTRVVSEGAPGYTAYVSRIVDDEREELYYDRYLPVSKIVETGGRPIFTSDK